MFFLFRQSTCVPVLTHLPPSFLHLPPCESPSNKCYQPIGRNWNRMSTVALTSPRYFSTSNKNMKICPWLEQALPKYFTSNSKKLIVWSHSMLIVAQIQIKSWSCSKWESNKTVILWQVFGQRLMNVSFEILCGAHKSINLYSSWYCIYKIIPRAETWTIIGILKSPRYELSHNMSTCTIEQAVARRITFSKLKIFIARQTNWWRFSIAVRRGQVWRKYLNGIVLIHLKIHHSPDEDTFHAKRWQ